jgi:hypothetical protein
MRELDELHSGMYAIVAEAAGRIKRRAWKRLPMM